MLAVLRHLPTALIVMLGLGATLSTTVWVERWEKLSKQSEFQKQTNNLTTAVQRTTNRYTELLLSISDLYDAAENGVDEATFQRFVSRAIATYPGIQALEWAPEIPQRDRADYEQQLKTVTQNPQALITERDSDTGQLIPARERNRYVPVTFLEPVASNEVALGYDLASDDTRRVALEIARDTGTIATTGRIQLVQETNADQYGFLVFVPIYQAVAATLPERRAAIEGYVLGVFRVADVVEESLRDLDYDIDFYILDQTATPPDQLLGVYQTSTQSVSADPQAIAALEPTSFLCTNPSDCTQTIQLGQRQWQIVFVPPASRSLLWGTLATLIIGLLLTTTVLVYFLRWQSELQRTQELSELKLRLFSMASHELRTPLSIISVSAQSLETSLDELPLEKQAKSIHRIQLAAQRMGKLVSDILTLTRAEAGKLEFNPEIIALEPFGQELSEQITWQAGQILVMEGNAAKAQMFADKHLLTLILINVLSNASKYSPERSVIRLVINQAKNTICFQVTDQGIGILAEERSAILEAFYRGKNVGTVSGTGLGLAVVKTCVDRHQGTLEITNNLDQGTRITVTLPYME
ncbi:MAG: CHASE domain-containing protein [Cyanobacteria bacterium P01_A01_bin.123]